MKKNVDALIVVENSNLIKTVSKGTTMVDAFREADGVLKKGVQGITDLITIPGFINIDFADIKTIMKDYLHFIMNLSGCLNSFNNIFFFTFKHIFSFQSSLYSFLLFLNLFF